MKKVFTLFLAAAVWGILGFSGTALAQAPVNDSVCNAIPLVNFDTLLVFNNLGATSDTSEAAIAPLTVGPAGQTWNESGITHSVWFTFIAPASGAIKFDMCNDSTDFDTQLAVYDVGDCNDYGTFALRGANDDIEGRCPVGDEWASILEVNCLIPGREYYLIVDGWVAGSTFDSTGTFGVVMSSIPGSVLDLNTLSIDPTCGNTNDGIAAVLATGGDQNYTYLWNTGSTNNFLPSAGPGTYTVTVRDGCDSVRTATVVLDDPSTTAPLTITAPDTMLRCDGDSVGVGSRIQIKGGIPLAKENAIGLRAAQTGYELTTYNNRNLGGLTNVNTFGNVPLTRCGDIAFGALFVLDSDQDRLFAINLQTGNATPFPNPTGVLPPNFEWYGMAFDQTTGTMYAVAGSTLGQGGTVSASLYTINLNTGAGTLVAPLSGADALPVWLACDNNGDLYAGEFLNDNLVSIDKATGAVTNIGFLDTRLFVYLDGDCDADFDPVTNTLYMVNTINGNFSTTLSVVDLTTGKSIPVGSYPGGTFMPVFALRDIPEDTYNFTWFPTNFMDDATSANPMALPPNGFPPYVVTVRDQCGNIVQDTIKVFSPPSMTATGSSTADDGTGNGTASVNPVNGIPPYTVTWNTGGTTSTISDLQGDSTYSYTVVDSCGTIETGDVFVVGNTSTNDLLGSGLNALEVYPNPARSSVSVRIETIRISDVSVELLDARGSVLSQRVLRSTLGEEFSMEISDFPAGMYIIKVATSQGSVYKKLIKQ